MHAVSDPLRNVLDRLVVPYEAEKIGEDTRHLRVIVQCCPCGRVVKQFYSKTEGVAR